MYNASAPPPPPAASSGKSAFRIIRIVVGLVIAAALLFFKFHPTSDTDRLVKAYNTHTDLFTSFDADSQAILAPFMALPDDASFTNPANVALLQGTVSKLVDRTAKYGTDEAAIDKSGCPDDVQQAWKPVQDRINDLHVAVSSVPRLNADPAAGAGTPTKGDNVVWSINAMKAITDYEKKIPPMEDAALHLKDVVKTHGVEFKK